MPCRCEGVLSILQNPALLIDELFAGDDMDGDGGRVGEASVAKLRRCIGGDHWARIQRARESSSEFSLFRTFGPREREWLTFQQNPPATSATIGIPAVTDQCASKSAEDVDTKLVEFVPIKAFQNSQPTGWVPCSLSKIVELRLISLTESGEKDCL